MRRTCCGGTAILEKDAFLYGNKFSREERREYKPQQWGPRRPAQKLLEKTGRTRVSYFHVIRPHGRLTDRTVLHCGAAKFSAYAERGRHAGDAAAVVDAATARGVAAGCAAVVSEIDTPAPAD